VYFETQQANDEYENTNMQAYSKTKDHKTFKVLAICNISTG